MCYLPVINGNAKAIIAGKLVFGTSSQGQNCSVSFLSFCTNCIVGHSPRVVPKNHGLLGRVGHRDDVGVGHVSDGPLGLLKVKLNNVPLDADVGYDVHRIVLDVVLGVEI